MFLLALGRDPIEGLFFSKDLEIQFRPPADLAAAHKWWCLSDWHHRSLHQSIYCVLSNIGTWLTPPSMLYYEQDHMIAGQDMKIAGAW